MDDDKYFTISQPGKSQFREKMSRFIGFAFPISNAEDAKALIKNIQNEYHDSRHVCWAYSLGPHGEEWMLNDNGEPSGTAGKPILGQIRSKELTNVLVAVVRYFGGIKLGTSGLIAAYRQAASLALDDAPRKECHSFSTLEIQFPYMVADKVMKLTKTDSVEVVSRNFDNLCSLRLEVWNSYYEELSGRLSKIEGLVIL